MEKNQPQRSIFNLGTIRHNVPSKELSAQYQKDAIDSGKVASRPTRLVEWNEPNRAAQKYDKHVTPKIGSIHNQNV